MIGKMRSGQEQIDVSSLEAGIYILKVSDGIETKSFRFMKK